MVTRVTRLRYLSCLILFGLTFLYSVSIAARDYHPGEFSIAPNKITAATKPPNWNSLDKSSQKPVISIESIARSDPDKLQSIAEWNSHRSPTKNGISHQLGLEARVEISPNSPALQSSDEKSSPEKYGQLTATADGSVLWSASVHVEKAYRLRLYLKNVKLPDGAELWVYNDQGESVGPFGAELIDDQGNLYTPSVSGPDLMVLVSLPKESAAAQLTVSDVVELFKLNDSGQPVISQTEASDLSCLADAQCFDSSTFPKIDIVEKAVARISYMRDGGSYVCTGGLLNDTVADSYIPYFLTTSNCIDNQASASSLEAFWDYTPATCGGPMPELDSLPRSNGATLLETNAVGIFALLELSDIPSNRWFLGWSARSDAIEPGTIIHRISHADLGTQSYSQSRIDGSDEACGAWPRSSSIYQTQIIGGTSGSSSGALAVTTEGYVVGQLLGTCGVDPGNKCDYSNYLVDGSLNSYWPYISKYLDPQTSGAADLAITVLDAVDGSYSPGDSLDVETRIENLGTTNSGNYKITFYASVDSTITTNDYELSYWERGSLAPGTNAHSVFRITLKAGIPGGTYFIGAKLDVTDANSGNNTKHDPSRITIQGTDGPEAGSKYSGSWFNPDRDGEGFHIEVLENNQVLVIWFTYPGISDNVNAEQAWILGTGTYSNGVITIVGAYKTRGPVFGNEFDKDDLVLDTWGDITITFADKNNALVEYDGEDGFGTTNVTRLTGLADPADAGGLPIGISGGWFDPDTEGQGWFVEVISKTQALVYWFTYDENGNQAWNLGVGDIVGNSILVADSQSGKNTRFGSAFKAGDVVRETFAGFTLNFTTCASGEIQYFTESGGHIGSLSITRLTQLQGTICEELPGPEDGQVAVMSDPADPWILSHEGVDGSVVDLFATRDDNGMPEKIDGGRITLPNGEAMRLYFDAAQKSFDLINEQSRLRLSVNELENGLISIRVIDPGSGTEVEVFGQGSVTSESAVTVKENHDSGTEATPNSSTQGNIRSTDAAVEVELCGQPVDPQQTKVEFIGGRADIPEANWDNPEAPFDNFKLWDSDGYQAGRFTKQLKFDDGELDELARQKACESSLNLLEENLCPFVGAATLIFGGGCGLLALKNPALGFKCATAVVALGGSADVYCKLNTVKQGICVGTEKIERTLASTIDIWAEAEVLASGTWLEGSTGPKDLLPGSELVMDKIQITADKPVILAITADPPQPVAGGSYALKVKVGCKHKVGDTNFSLSRNGQIEKKSCTVLSDDLCWFEDLTTEKGATFEDIEILAGTEPESDDEVVASKKIKLELSPIQPPVLSYPEDGTSLVNNCDQSSSLNWYFEWSDVALAHGYNLEVTDPSGDPTTTFSGTNQYTYQMFGSNPLTGDQLGNWSWRVQSLDETQTGGPWSDRRVFEVESCSGSTSSRFEGEFVASGTLYKGFDSGPFCNWSWEFNGDAEATLDKDELSLTLNFTSTHKDLDDDGSNQNDCQTGTENLVWEIDMKYDQGRYIGSTNPYDELVYLFEAEPTEGGMLLKMTVDYVYESGAFTATRSGGGTSLLHPVPQ